MTSIAPNSPLVTFALFAYNHEAVIREAIEGALSQTYQPLEIILSDDGSVDRTFEIMSELVDCYQGPHRVRLIRNETNLGLAKHINRVLALAEGELIVLAAGDDISFPERTATILSAWIANDKRADLLCSEYDTISPEGKQGIGPRVRREDWEDARSVARYGFCPLGATCTWTRRLWESFGDIPLSVRNEDQLMAFRAHLGGGIQLCPERLLAYREGSSNWNVSKDADLDEYTRHHKKIAPFQVSVAEAVVADARRMNRPDLIQLAEQRLLQCKIIDNIYNGRLVDYRMLLKGLRQGSQWNSVAKPYFERKFPMLFRYIRQRRRDRKASNRC